MVITVIIINRVNSSSSYVCSPAAKPRRPERAECERRQDRHASLHEPGGQPEQDDDDYCNDDDYCDEEDDDDSDDDGNGYDAPCFTPWLWDKRLDKTIFYCGEEYIAIVIAIAKKLLKLSESLKALLQVVVRKPYGKPVDVWSTGVVSASFIVNQLAWAIFFFLYQDAGVWHPE